MPIQRQESIRTIPKFREALREANNILGFLEYGITQNVKVDKATVLDLINSIERVYGPNATPEDMSMLQFGRMSYYWDGWKLLTLTDER